MIELLQRIHGISACRDREAAAQAVVAGIYDVMKPDSVMLFRVASAVVGPTLIPYIRRNALGLEVIGSDEDENPGDLQDAVGVPLDHFPLLERAYASGWVEERHPTSGRCKEVWSVRPNLSGLASELLVIDAPRLIAAHERDALRHFLGFYGNYLDLLDYSELDTLTGLSNRKTYDEALDRIIAAIPGECHAPQGLERRHPEAAGGKTFWLGVVDIDHFKRINDNFGHLFGDEVLLRIANLMKQSFRTSDKLFRFGGEEFVVMLRPACRDDAEKAFERFRQAVEGHEFPQVGQVTCSIGFTRIDSGLSPTDTLGRADEALYFSKENGRNRVSCHECLVEAGLLDSKEIEARQPDFDIDALFA